MKKVILIFAILFSFVNLQAQKTITTDASGNYVVSKQETSKSTGKYLIDADGTRNEVWQSVNGKLYVLRVSKKSGKQYKQYLNI